MLDIQTFNLLLRSCLLASLLACAGTDDPAKQTLPYSPGDAESGAQSVLYDAMLLNSAFSAAFGRVKNDPEADPFLLYDEIQRELTQTVISKDHAVDGAAEELLELMQMTEKVELTAKVHALLARFTELISLPREDIPSRRLATFLNDCSKLSSELRVFVTWDDADRPRSAYYFAPAYNVIVSTHIFASAAAGFVRSSIEPIYRDAIDTNQQLVGSGEADDLGILSDWVVSQTPGSASARVKYDRDPILYSIRRSLTEQQGALE